MKIHAMLLTGALALSSFAVPAMAKDWKNVTIRSGLETGCGQYLPCGIRPGMLTTSGER